MKIIHVIAKSAEQTTQTNTTNRIVPRNKIQMCTLYRDYYVHLWTFMLLVNYNGMLYVRLLRSTKKAFASSGGTKSYSSVAYSIWY